RRLVMDVAVVKLRGQGKMTVPQVRRLRAVVALAILLLGSISPCSRAEEPAEQTKPEEIAAPQQPGTPDKPKPNEDTAGQAKPNADMASIATFATVSPIWRGGNNELQNNGFGVLSWIGASWQGKIVSVRATACISCHGVKEPGLISRIEPVEVAVHVDITSYLDPRCKGMKGSIDAGRFIV